MLVEGNVLPCLIDLQELAFVVEFGEAVRVLLEDLHGGSFAPQFLQSPVHVLLHVGYIEGLLRREEHLLLDQASDADQVIDLIHDFDEEGQAPERLLLHREADQGRQHGLHLLCEAREVEGSDGLVVRHFDISD